MALVEDFMMGSTHIQIYDDKCVSPEEADKILKRLSKKVQPYFCNLEKRLWEEEQRKGST